MNETTNALALARELLALREKATQGYLKDFLPLESDPDEDSCMGTYVLISEDQSIFACDDLSSAVADFIAAAANHCEAICTALEDSKNGEAYLSRQLDEIREKREWLVNEHLRLTEALEQAEEKFLDMQAAYRSATDKYLACNNGQTLEQAQARIAELEEHLAASQKQCRAQMEYPARESLKRDVLDVLRRYEQERPGHPVAQQVDTALSWCVCTVEEMEARIAALEAKCTALKDELITVLFERNALSDKTSPACIDRRKTDRRQVSGRFIFQQRAGSERRATALPTIEELIAIEPENKDQLRPFAAKGESK